jgi:hypothetical protein
MEGLLIALYIAIAQQLLREHENAVLATWWRDGRLKNRKIVAQWIESHFD